eukprot:3711817-Amphidinium_carterae.1
MAWMLSPVFKTLEVGSGSRNLSTKDSSAVPLYPVVCCKPGKALLTTIPPIREQYPAQAIS